MDPKVTVFMPVYNGEKYLREAIESILNQTFNNFEFLIIDDGSTDKSVKIIKSYSDDRIKFIENEANIGAMLTANIGFELANGKYIVRMDQDDVSLPNRIAKQVDFMDKNPQIDVCGSWVEFFGDTNYLAKYAKDHKIIVTTMFTNCPFAHPSIIMRKSMFDKFNIRYSQLTGEEYELWVRASKYLKFANVQSVLLKYRTSPNQMTKSLESTLNANKIVWRMQLENLEIDFSDEELNLHYLLMSEKYSIISLKDFFNKSNSWLDKIIEANSKKKIYDHNMLLKLLQRKWYIAFKTITDTDNNFYLPDIFNTKHFKYLSSKDKFKFLYRFIKKKLKNRQK